MLFFEFQFLAGNRFPFHSTEGPVTGGAIPIRAATHAEGRNFAWDEPHIAFQSRINFGQE
jgi:hypothetical protein